MQLQTFILTRGCGPAQVGSPAAALFLHRSHCQRLYGGAGNTDTLLSPLSEHLFSNDNVRLFVRVLGIGTLASLCAATFFIQIPSDPNFEDGAGKEEERDAQVSGSRLHEGIFTALRELIDKNVRRIFPEGYKTTLSLIVSVVGILALSSVAGVVCAVWWMVCAHWWIGIDWWRVISDIGRRGGIVEYLFNTFIGVLVGIPVAVAMSICTAGGALLYSVLFGFPPLVREFLNYSGMLVLFVMLRYTLLPTSPTMPPQAEEVGWWATGFFVSAVGSTTAFATGFPDLAMVLFRAADALILRRMAAVEGRRRIVAGNAAAAAAFLCVSC